MNAGQFKKGQIPWNKGTKGIMPKPVNGFQKGNKCWKERPVGSVWGTDSFCTAPICAGLCSIPCYINDAAKSASTTDDAGFFKKTIKTYQIPSKS